jgi:translation initiation factor IF-3
VRVVNEDGQQLGVMATDAARDVAGRLGLDLVEIAPTARPPVVKIMDYGRYKYELKKKAATAKKAQHQSQVKEVKLRPRISEHDLAFKMRNARKFLFEGDKVKCTVMFRGREIQHKKLGYELLKDIAARLEEIAAAESNPQAEGRTLTFTLAPNRQVIERLKVKEEKQRAAEEAAEGEEASEGDGPIEAAAATEAPAPTEAVAPTEEVETAEETERA